MSTPAEQVNSYFRRAADADLEAYYAQFRRHRCRRGRGP